MLTVNPFSTLAELISPAMMQNYVILMVLLVVGGTILHMVAKKSHIYFFENSKKAQKSAKRTVGGGEKIGLVVSTVTSEVMTSSEFCNPARRVSHLLMMYGFITFIVSTATLIFSYPTAAEAGSWPMLWHLGAAMVAVGGYWFWFLIRVDRASEGQPLARLVIADLFILSLLGTVTFALLWSFTGSMLMFVLFIVFATVLFGGVMWSKFSHMFFKPAAAYQKKITKADGSQENLPDVGEMNDPEIQARYPDIPEYMGTNPPNMGLGIKREAPTHF